MADQHHDARDRLRVGAAAKKDIPAHALDVLLQTMLRNAAGLTLNRMLPCPSDLFSRGARFGQNICLAHASRYRSGDRILSMYSPLFQVPGA